jgi:NAD-dependent SIR2 family protein deacetylase
MDNKEFIEKKNLLLDKINNADMVLVGIGEEFNEDFKDIGKFPLLMSALEEVDVNTTLEWTVPHLEKRFLMAHNESPTIDAYNRLLDLIRDKNYFILTTCIDENIRKADFKKERVVEPCGNYQKFQCSKKCNTKLYPADEFSDLVKQALIDGVGLDSLEMPVCPCCGAPLVFNNILCERNYVEEGYKPQWTLYTEWLQGTLNKNLCILELGVGMNLPDVIRWPFEKIAFYNNKASFFRINETLYQMTEELADKGVSIEKNAIEFLNEI